MAHGLQVQTHQQLDFWFLGKYLKLRNTLSTQLVWALSRAIFGAERRKKLVYQMMPQAALTQKAAVSFRHSQLRRLTCQTVFEVTQGAL